ncbi:MAG: AAA family ATPase, partial [Myxococcota bacterium]
RPRRFGKTMNMNMLHCFLRAPEVFAPKGSTKPQHNKKENQDLFDGLEISRAGEAYQLERGKRPVLFISFRTVKEMNWDDAWIRMRSLLSSLAQETSQGAPVDKLLPTKQRILQEMCAEKINPADCESILRIITELLMLKHNGMTPWVLIDEYDAPMQAAYQYDYYKPMRNLMKGLLGDCLKDSDFLHKAVITGIVRVAKEDIFSDLNNLGVYGVLQDRFASCFGFTHSEVKGLLALREADDHLAAVRTWYNGYRIGIDRAVTVYNPWSLINHLANLTQIPQPYWVNTSTNHLVHELLSRADITVKQGLHQLLDPAGDHTTTQTVCEYVPLRDVERKAENLWGLLLAAGYLTAAGMTGSPDNLDKIVHLRIPNDEVRRVYGDLVNRWLRGGEAGGGRGMELLDALVAGEVEVFAGRFERLVLTSMSYFDPGGGEPERFYHGFILGIMQHLRDRYIVDSQRESGLGRYDLALEPRDKTKLGFVLEFKSCIRESDSLSETAQTALQQIQDKHYHVHLMERGVKTVIALGLAFKGKQATVAHATLTKAD